MLDISIKVDNKNVLINLDRYDEGIRRRAVPNILRRFASFIAKDAVGNLSGPRRGLKTITAKKSGRQRAVAMGVGGGYPVPRLTGNLRRMLRWLGPSRSVSSGGKTFSTGSNESIIFDSANYAGTIHDGKDSSAKYGARPFIDDAARDFSKGALPRTIIEKELHREKVRSGLE